MSARSRPTRCGRRCERPSSAGRSSARTHPSTRSASASPRCSGSRPRCGCRPCGMGEPRRDAHVLRARREGRARGGVARSLVRVDGDHRDRAARAAPVVGSGRTHGSGGRRGGRGREPRGAADPREHPHPGRWDDALGRADRRARRGCQAPRLPRAHRRRAAAQRLRRAGRAARRTSPRRRTRS